MGDQKDPHVPLTRRALTWTLSAVVAANIVLLLGTYLGLRWEGMHWRLHHLGTSLDLSRENNLATWYASMLLLAVAAAQFLCFLLDRGAYPKEGASPVERALSWGWLALVLAFVLLSLDEMGSLHERVGQLPGADLIPGVESLRAWAGALAIPIAAVAAGMLAFGWARLRQSPAAFGMMVLGVLLLLTVPLHEHLELAMWEASGLGWEWQRPRFFSILEEGAEVFGSAAFLAAALLYARMRAVNAAPGEAQPSAALLIRTRHVGIWAGAAAAGLLLVYVLIPEIAAADGSRGVPQNWFPAATALAAAGMAALLAINRATSMPLLLVAFLCLAFSIDHGSDHVWQDVFFTSGRLLPEGVRVALLVAVVGGAATFLFVRVAGGALRAGAVGWAFLLIIAMAVFNGTEIRPVLALAGHIALTTGLATSWRDRTVANGAEASSGPRDGALPQPDIRP